MLMDDYIWVKDQKGERYFCSHDMLKDWNHVDENKKEHCVDEASRLSQPHTVPGEGKLKFTKSTSLN